MATRHSRNHKRNRKQSPLKVFHGRAWAWLSFVERNCKILERQPHNQNFIMPRGVLEVGGGRWCGSSSVCVCLRHAPTDVSPWSAAAASHRVASVCGFKRQVLDKLRRRWLQASLGNKCVPRSALPLQQLNGFTQWSRPTNTKKKKPPPNKLQQLQATSSTSSLVLALTRSLSLSVSVSRSCALSPAAQNRQCYVSRRPWGPKLLVLRQPTVSLGAHAHARSPIQRKSNRIQIETESLSGYSTVPTFDLLQHQDLSFSVAITHTILNTIRYAYDTHTICNIPWIVWKMRWKETQRNFISVFFGYLCGSVRFA